MRTVKPLLLDAGFIPIGEEAQYLGVERIGALPHWIVPGLRQCDQARARNDRGDLRPTASGVMASRSPQTTSVGASIRLRDGSQSVCSASMVAAISAARMAAQQVANQQRREPRQAAADRVHCVRRPSDGACLMRTDRGIDKYQPVDAVRMARGKPCRHGSTE